MLVAPTKKKSSMRRRGAPIVSIYCVFVDKGWSLRWCHITGTVKVKNNAKS
jgi:hypothetical protein